MMKKEQIHKNLLRDIREEFEEEINQLKIEPTSYSDIQGRSQVMFNLTIKQSRQIYMKESRNVRKKMLGFLDEIEQNIKDKGYFNFTGKILLDVNEWVAVDIFSEYCQSYEYVKQEMKLAIDNLAKKYDGNYAMAYMQFNKDTDYNLKDLESLYEDYCDMSGHRRLKSISKLDMTMICRSDKFVDLFLHSIKINHKIDGTKLSLSIKDLMNVRKLTINKDSTTVALFEYLRPDNHLKQLNIDHKLFLLLG